MSANQCKRAEVDIVINARLVPMFGTIIVHGLITVWVIITIGYSVYF